MVLPKAAKDPDVASVLTALEPLGPNQYCIAFGPGATQFCATPNGYSAALLPSRIVDDLLGGKIKKVLHASFGSGVDSFFFTYQLVDGNVAHRAGKGIPSALRAYIDRIASTSAESNSALRVQLGDQGSYIAWTGAQWVSCGIPEQLFRVLNSLSTVKPSHTGGDQGELENGTIDNIAWHGTGSWYIRNGAFSMNNLDRAPTSKLVQQAVTVFLKPSTDELLSEIAYVALNPHSPTGETFALFTRAEDGQNPQFVLRFEPEEVVCRYNSAPQGICEERPPDGPVLEEQPYEHNQITRFPKADDGLKTFRWGISKRSGRSHTSDLWELELKKGERVKVLKDMGNDWLLAETRQKEMGWVHRSWIDFQKMLPHVDPREAYSRFTTDMEKLIQTGNIRTLPKVIHYMDACVKETCRELKMDTQGLGICVHDLHELLRGSGEYGYTLETLKLERNKWHPDKFSRSCHPDHREHLRDQAQALFVLIGVLMDALENAPISEPAN